MLNIKSRRNSRGFSILELMVVIGITLIISLFAFDSVRQVIVASMGAQKKTSFDSLTDDVRFLTNRLDQCTCNFNGITSLPLNVAANYVYPLPVQQLVRFSTPQAAGCGAGGAGNFVVAQAGISQQDGSVVQDISLGRIQYLAAMNVVRARLILRSMVKQQVGQNSRLITRQFPVMFSVNPASTTAASAPIVGCIGMTGTPPTPNE